MINLDTQIKAAIKALFERVEQIDKETTYDNLLELNDIGNDLMTLAKQGEEYKNLILRQIKDEWLEKFIVMRVLKNMLSEALNDVSPEDKK